MEDVAEEFRDRGVICLEQPLEKGKESFLKKFKGEYPIMLDESLCSMEDAKRAIEEGYGDIFNIRISKNGGIINSLRIYKLAEENGIDCQIGCMVGESGILSAAGAQLAHMVPRLTFLEGSYGTHLLSEDVTEQKMTFGVGASLNSVRRRLNPLGLGVDINSTRLNKYLKNISSIDF